VAILSISEPDAGYRYRRAFLVDLVVSPRDPALLQGTFDAVYRACRGRNAHAIVFYVINRALARAAHRYGFLRREPTRYLLALLPEGDPLSGHILDADRWLITQGDSDIDRPW